MKKPIILLFALLLTGAVEAQELLGQTYYANGRLQSTRYSDGAVEHFILYHPNGRVQATGMFRDGRRDGVWRQFAENGTVVAEARFKAGHRTGVWEFRDDANGLKGRLVYTDGRLASGEQFDPTGELIAQRTY